MKITVDSREKPQAIEKILAWFDNHGIEWEKKKLDTGDYMVEGKPDIVVDRKGDLLELAHNMLTADKARFYREVRRARESGIRLIILCEHGGIKDLNDVSKWKPKFGRSNGKRLADAIFRLEVSYNVPTFFCDPRSTGRRIVELLSGEDHGDEDILRSE